MGLGFGSRGLWQHDLLQHSGFVGVLSYWVAASCAQWLNMAELGGRGWMSCAHIRIAEREPTFTNHSQAGHRGWVPEPKHSILLSSGVCPVHTCSRTETGLPMILPVSATAGSIVALRPSFASDLHQLVCSTAWQLLAPGKQTQDSPSARAHTPVASNLNPKPWNPDTSSAHLHGDVPLVHGEELEGGVRGLAGLGVPVHLHRQVLALWLPEQLHLCVPHAILVSLLLLLLLQSRGCRPAPCRPCRHAALPLVQQGRGCRSTSWRGLGFRIKDKQGSTPAGCSATTINGA